MAANKTPAAPAPDNHDEGRKGRAEGSGSDGGYGADSIKVTLLPGQGADM